MRHIDFARPCAKSAKSALRVIAAGLFAHNALNARAAAEARIRSKKTISIKRELTERYVGLEHGQTS
jgi:hypothetical protein